MLEIYSTIPMVLKTEHGFTLVHDCLNYVKLKKKNRLVNNLLLNIIAIRSSERR
jgi:hypothetical protein